MMIYNYSRTSRVFPPSWPSMVNSFLPVMFRSRCFLVRPEWWWNRRMMPGEQCDIILYRFLFLLCFYNKYFTIFIQQTVLLSYLSDNLIMKVVKWKYDTDILHPENILCGSWRLSAGRSFYFGFINWMEKIGKIQFTKRKKYTWETFSRLRHCSLNTLEEDLSLETIGEPRFQVVDVTLCIWWSGV